MSKKRDEIFYLAAAGEKAMSLCRIGFDSDVSPRIRTKPSFRLVAHGSTKKGCVKRSFRNRDQAKEAITKNRYTRNRLISQGFLVHRLENRYWFCKTCFSYHLTSKPMYSGRENQINVA